MTVEISGSLIGKIIYAAPIGDDAMRDSFDNKEIDDWRERHISVWSDLKQEKPKGQTEYGFDI
jgi:hypothetical protein